MLMTLATLRAELTAAGALPRQNPACLRSVTLPDTSPLPKSSPWVRKSQAVIGGPVDRRYATGLRLACPQHRDESHTAGCSFPCKCTQVHSSTFFYDCLAQQVGLLSLIASVSSPTIVLCGGATRGAACSSLFDLSSDTGQASCGSLT